MVLSSFVHSMRGTFLGKIPLLLVYRRATVPEGVE